MPTLTQIPAASSPRLLVKAPGKAARPGRGRPALQSQPSPVLYRNAQDGHPALMALRLIADIAFSRRAIGGFLLREFRRKRLERAFAEMMRERGR